MNNPAYLLWMGGSILLSFGFFLLLGRGCNNRGRLAAVAFVPTVLLGAFARASSSRRIPSVCIDN